MGKEDEARASIGQENRTQEFLKNLEAALRSVKPPN